MIQPVSAFSPRAGFRGSNKSYGQAKPKASREIAIINATGTSLAAGGLTTAIARSYTSSWSHAGALGVCGAVLAALFIAPQLVESTSSLKTKSVENAKPANKTVAAVKGTLKPTKKLVLFRQS